MKDNTLCNIRYEINEKIFFKINYPSRVAHSAKLLCHQSIGIKDYSQLPSSLHFCQLHNLQIFKLEI